MWAIQQRLQALLAERKIRIEMDEELAESVRVIEAWRQHYSRDLPHSAPGCEPRSGSRAGSARSNSMKVRLSPLAPAPRLCYDVNGSASSDLTSGSLLAARVPLRRELHTRSRAAIYRFLETLLTRMMQRSLRCNRKRTRPDDSSRARGKVPDRRDRR
jgi:hypothetical protein